MASEAHSGEGAERSPLQRSERLREEPGCPPDPGLDGGIVAHGIPGDFECFERKVEQTSLRFGVLLCTRSAMPISKRRTLCFLRFAVWHFV